MSDDDTKKAPNPFFAEMDRAITERMREEMRRAEDARVLQGLQSMAVPVEMLGIQVTHFPSVPEVKPFVPGAVPKKLFPEFSDTGHHPQQCVDWLLSTLDFDAEDDNTLNVSYCGDANQSFYSYLRDMEGYGLTFSTQERVLVARMEGLEELLELMDYILDWKALKRYLQGSYDDDLAKGKLPFALTKGAKFDDD